MATKSELERIAILETKVDDICTKIDTVNDKLDKFIEAADRKYAPSWVAWFAKAVIVGGLTAGIGILVFLLERHII